MLRFLKILHMKMVLIGLGMTCTVTWLMPQLRFLLVSQVIFKTLKKQILKQMRMMHMISNGMVLHPLEKLPDCEMRRKLNALNDGFKVELSYS
ncbi:hypothetical protein LINPERHAP2_LOCUS37537 [Linum perenne]